MRNKALMDKKKLMQGFDGQEEANADIDISVNEGTGFDLQPASDGRELDLQPTNERRGFDLLIVNEGIRFDLQPAMEGREFDLKPADEGRRGFDLQPASVLVLTGIGIYTGNLGTRL